MQGYLLRKNRVGRPSSGQEGRSLMGRRRRWGLKLMGFPPPPTSLLSGYQCPLFRHRHDFHRLKSEEGHKQLLTEVGRPESKVDGVASSPLLLPCYQASTISILPAGGTRPAFSNPSSHSKRGSGREALTLEVSRQVRQGKVLHVLKVSK